MYVHVCACICMYVHVCACMCMYVHVCACIYMYLHVFACICMYVHVFACMCMNLIIGFAVSVASFRPALMITHITLLRVARHWHLRRASKAFTWLLVCFGVSTPHSTARKTKFTWPGFPRKTDSCRELKRFLRILICSGPFSLSWSIALGATRPRLWRWACTYIHVYACIW